MRIELLSLLARAAVALLEGRSQESSDHSRLNQTEPREVVFDSNEYSTDHHLIPGWVDPLFERLPFSTTVSSFLLGSAVFLLGFLISISINFERGYLLTLPVYLGGFGIAWTAGILRYGSRKVHECYAELRPCFLVSDQQYRELVEKWMQRIWNRRGNALISAVFFALASAGVWSSFYAQWDFLGAQIRSLRPVSFGEAWFNGVSTNGKVVIILIFGLVASLLLAPAARSLAVNFAFLLDLRKLPVIPAANVIRSRLRPVTHFYMVIAFTWFVGVGLFGVVFLDVYDWLSISFLLALSLLGTLTFLTPQVVFHRYLASSYRLACDVALRALNRQMGIVLKEDDGPLSESRLPVKLPVVGSFGEVVEASARPFRLVYDAEDILVLLFGQAVTVGVFLLQIFLERASSGG